MVPSITDTKKQQVDLPVNLRNFSFVVIYLVEFRNILVPKNATPSFCESKQRNAEKCLLCARNRIEERRYFQKEIEDILRVDYSELRTFRKLIREEPVPILSALRGVHICIESHSSTGSDR